MTGINVGGPDGCHDDAPGDHSRDALAGIPGLLITGSHNAQADFKHYVEKHRPALVPQITGYETVDHPSDGQLVALARKYFVKYDRMAGGPTPT